MSNLKKVVSLVLVLAMVFAMGASASAAFSDKDDINFADEVNLLTSLNVLSGYPDGSFKPAGSVTRAEYAKMLFMVKLGHLDASGFESTVVPFTDLGQAAWAQGYIKYLYSIGVVAGKSATTFDPNAQVTGYEAVKMLLVVLGYKADQAQLVGAKWKLNTLALGVDRGILDDYDKDFDAPATRELAALLIANALDAVCVKYSGLSLDVNGNLTADVVDETHNDGGNTILSTLGWKAFGLCYETGYIAATKHMAVTGTDDKTDDDTFTIEVTGGTYAPKLTEDGDPNFVADLKYEDLDESLIGQEVTVSFKEASNGDLEVYGVVPTGKSNVYVSDLVKTKYADEKLTVYPDGTKKEFKDIAANDVLLQVVTVDDGEVSYADRNLSIFEDDGAEPKVPGKLVLVDGNDKDGPEYGYVIAGTFGRIDTYSEEDEEFTLTGNDSYDYNDDDFEKISGEFEVGDWCFATPDLAGDVEIVPAEKVTLKPTKIKDDMIYDDDVSYYCLADFVNLSDFDFGSTYTVYTDGSFIARKTTDTTEVVAIDNIALVTYIDPRLKVVKLLNAEGDEEIYNYTNKNTDDIIEDVLETAAETGAAYLGEYGIVKFTVDDNGDAKLSTISDDSAEVGVNPNFDTGKDVIEVGGVSYLMDSNSKVFVVDTGADPDFDVFTKTDLKDGTDLGGDYTVDNNLSGSVVYRTTSAGYKYVVAASVKLLDTDVMPEAATTDKFVFLTDDPDEWETDDGNFVGIVGQCEGEAVEYTSEDLDFEPVFGSDDYDDAQKFDWVKISLNSDGEISSDSFADVDTVDPDDGDATVSVLLAAGGLHNLVFDEDVDENNVVAGAIAAFDMDYESISFHDADSEDGNENYLPYDYKIDDDTDFYVMDAKGNITEGSADDLKTADVNLADDNFYLNCFYGLKDAAGDDVHVEFIVIITTNRLTSLDSDFAFPVI